MMESRALMAVIFDMDGVLIDSEKHWLRIGVDLVKRWVPTWSDADNHFLVGLGPEPLHQLLVNRFGLRADFGSFVEDYRASIQAVYTDHAVLLDGVVDCIQAVRVSGVRTALVSSSARQWIDLICERLQVTELFDMTLSASDLNCPSKPAPDLYIAAAQQLNVEPGQCLVIEDSQVGVQAATAAGMVVIGLRNGFNGSQELSLAAYELAGFGRVQVQQLRNIHAGRLPMQG